MPRCIARMGEVPVAPSEGSRACRGPISCHRKIECPRHLSDAVAAVYPRFRGLSALWVLAFHLRLVVPAPQDPGIGRFLYGVATLGYLGVDVFFVISGFVVWRNYAGRFSKPTPRSWASFVRARVTRVYPVYAVWTTAMVAAILLVARDQGPMRALLLPSTLAANFLMLQVWLGVPSVVYIAWTVSALFGLYLVFPLAVPLLSRLRSVQVRLGLAAAGYAALIYCNTVFGWTDALPRAIAGFLAGSLLAAIFQQGGQRFSRTVAVGAELLLACYVIAHAAGAWPAFWPFSAISAGGLWIVTPVVAALVFGVAGCEDPFSRLLGKQPFVFLGTISYSVYLAQGVAIVVLGKLLSGSSISSPDGTLATVALLLLYLTAAAALSLSSYFLVERPSKAWLGTSRNLRSWVTCAMPVRSRQSTRPLGTVSCCLRNRRIVLESIAKATPQRRRWHCWPRYRGQPDGLR